MLYLKIGDLFSFCVRLGTQLQKNGKKLGQIYNFPTNYICKCGEVYKYLRLSSKSFLIYNFAYTVKRVDEVVRHPHLVTQDQFTQVSKKDIPEENFTINIELFRQNVTCVELLRYKRNVHDELVR